MNEISPSVSPRRKKRSRRRKAPSGKIIPWELLQLSSEELEIELESLRSKRREFSITRCRKSFFRLVRANMSKSPPALLTLTMLEIVDIAEAYQCLHKFGQRLRRTFGKSLSWIAVPEFQKRGAVHFHILIWEVPAELPCILGKTYRDSTGKKHRQHLCPEDRQCERRTRVIASIWKYGFVDLEKTDGSPKLATYLAKYMTKTISDSRLLKKKAYNATRNILRPEIYNNPFQVSIVLEMWDITKDTKPEYERKYDTKWLGQCRYTTYLLENDTIQP